MGIGEGKDQGEGEEKKRKDKWTRRTEAMRTRNKKQKQHAFTRGTTRDGPSADKSDLARSPSQLHPQPGASIHTKPSS